MTLSFKSTGDYMKLSATMNSAMKSTKALTNTKEIVSFVEVLNLSVKCSGLGLTQKCLSNFQMFQAATKSLIKDRG